MVFLANVLGREHMKQLGEQQHTRSGVQVYESSLT